MGVSFGNDECFDLFGFLFLTYYVLRVTAEEDVGYLLVTKGITGR